MVGDGKLGQAAVSMAGMSKNQGSGVGGKELCHIRQLQG